jgi:uncharacterized protein DUF4157/SH3 domain-containing protein
MSERQHAHAHARRGAEAAPELDELAPGRMTRTEFLAPSRRAVISGLIQRKASGAEISGAPDHAIAAAAGSAGIPLPEALLRKFEAALGTALSGVRVHTGSASHAAAEAIGAKAYTIGQDIHFSGRYDPTSPDTEHLLAHEVAHTVQQRGGTPAPQNKLEVSAPTDSFELEADRAADAMVAGTAYAVGSAPVVAARTPNEASGPGDKQAMNTVGFPIGEPTPVYSSPDPKATVLVKLPKGGSIHVIGTDGSYYVVSYDGTKKGYIDQGDLDVDGPATAVDTDPAAANATPADPAAAVSQQTAGERYRTAITKALDFWKGAVEGATDGKFAKFRSDSTLEKARKQAGTEHKTFTTCIEFLSQVQNDAARDSHTKQTVFVDSNLATPEGRKKLPAGAWHPGSPNMSERPRPGDVLFFTFAADVKVDGKVKFGKGWFSHVGYFNGIGKVDKPAADPAAADADPVELWHTVDGGQGTSTKYDAAGNMIGVQGHEELKQNDRFYHPKKNLITGEKIQGDADNRTLLGWVDVEKIVASDLPPDP